MSIYNLLFTTLSTLSILVIFLWAFYHAHVSDVRIKRIAFILVSMSSTVLLISIYIPLDETFANRQFLWQRLFFTLSIACYSIADFYCEYGSERFIEAFRNSKNRLIDLTKS